MFLNLTREEKAFVTACIQIKAENEKVNIVALILSPLDDPKFHLQVLTVLAQSLSKDGVIDAVSMMKTPSEIVNFFSNSS